MTPTYVLCFLTSGWLASCAGAVREPVIESRTYSESILDNMLRRLVVNIPSIKLTPKLAISVNTLSYNI